MRVDLPKAVRVVEVGPRDGLQNEKESIPVDAKIAFVNGLGRSGLQNIEVTSFVRPDAVPQLADAAEVLAGIDKREGVRYLVLVPNMRGLDRWLQSANSLPPGSLAIALFTAASEEFNRKNTGATIESSLSAFGQIMHRLDTELSSGKPFVRGYVSTAFRCPYEGRILPETVEWVTSALLDIGVEEISLGDTLGAAAPRQVYDLLDRLLPRVGARRLAMHFHDTRGTALANVLAAMECGVSTFDSSAAGLGGCPFAPGASGNLATEDLVYMLHEMQIETGVDLSEVVKASDAIRPFIGRELSSKELQAFKSAGF